MSTELPVLARGAAETVGRSPREHCRKCLRCIFACPTGALRVHAAGPDIRAGLCVGCTACFGECRSGVYGIREPGGRSGRFSRRSPKEPCSSSPGAFSPAFPSAARTVFWRRSRSCGFSEVRLLEEWTEALASGGARGRRFGAAPPCPSSRLCARPLSRSWRAGFPR